MKFLLCLITTISLSAACAARPTTPVLTETDEAATSKPADQPTPAVDRPPEGEIALGFDGGYREVGIEEGAADDAGTTPDVSAQD